MKKILLINTQMEKGGAQKAMLALASQLDKEKFDVCVATMYDKDAFIPYYEDLYSLKIVNLQMKDVRGGKIKNTIKSLRGLFRLWRLIRGEKFDVVQSYSHYPNIIVPIISFFAGVKKRYTSQRMSLDYLSGLVQRLDKWVANSFFVTKVISVSEGTLQSCVRQGIKADKLLVIPNGIKLPDKFLKENEKSAKIKEIGVEGKFVVAMVARLHRQKGHTFLIDAIKRVRMENLVVLLIGDGELKEQLVEQITNSGLSLTFKFLGSRDDVGELLQISDLFILPSLWEGMPNSVLEAMSYGLPIIATGVDGTPELISHNESGFLIESENSEAIADALSYIVSNDAIRENLGKNARKRVEEFFSLTYSIGSYEKLYLSNGVESS
ncbi:glycosyltransferase family 4 protein [Ekhidna sp.]|jgi:glycosyltransferase involved in cell wall biosynthesis|uniref:glycosyltransferase family 4 protein n=1 Tax=Ekhidna sp. TaxID=2608089 RepID=UPI0032EE7CA7